MSLVERTRSPDPEQSRLAWDALISAYWKPVYSYSRMTWGLGNEDAKDLAQGFFAAAMEGEFFATFDPARARFRTWLRTCLHGYAAKEQRAGRRLKRGGGAVHVELGDDIAGDDGLDARFRQEWVRAVFESAMERLAALASAGGRDIQFAVFRRYDVDGADESRRPTYAELAAEFGVPATQITNYLAWARRALRAEVLEVLREGAGSDAEFREDVRDLLGNDVP